VISLVNTISGKSLKLLPPDVILKLKCIKFDFRWGSAPDFAGGRREEEWKGKRMGKKGPKERGPKWARKREVEVIGST